ncbi:1238_t:CDS:2 [Funneliformis mosseae]|uniref:1238_t:CDS:1 n=1 Tax=Funneliformis mosseae TaxID=27381 RepID=A0A9N9E8E6_FUNMO|nr:1238_t:CDS:2 [Funneliformis mosseae]
MITILDDSVEKRVSMKYLPCGGNVVLETRGHVCRLRNEDEAREMSQSVLTGLIWLHKGGYVHRDIRLSNILFVPGVTEYKYVLIDFEHSNLDGLEVSEHLKDWDNSTLTITIRYVSIWKNA